MKVRAAVLVEPKKIELREFAMPEIGDEDAVIRVERAGICGTDPKLYRGLSARNSYPIILGHEILGRIEKMGARMAARAGVAPGDRVIIEAAVPCGDCSFCRHGFYKFCRQARSYGFVQASAPKYLWGAFSEYMYVAPNSMVHKIRDDVPAAAAVVAASSLGNGIRWMRTLGGATIGRPVVIQGVGPQGLAAVVAAKESGAAPIIVTGLPSDRSRLALARELGADICIDVQKDNVEERVKDATGGELADAVLDVTGSAEAIALSVRLVRPMGTLVCGGTTVGGKPVTLSTNDIVSKEIRFQGAWGHSAESVRQAINLAERGKYPLEKIVTHEFSLEEADLAVRAMGREVEGADPIKAALRP